MSTLLLAPRLDRGLSPVCFWNWLERQENMEKWNWERSLRKEGLSENALYDISPSKTHLWFIKKKHKKLRRNPSGNCMSNFNFQWTKTLYQNNLNNIAFFLHFWRAVDRCYQLSVIITTPKKTSYENLRKSKSTFKNWHSMRNSLWCY